MSEKFNTKNIKPEDLHRSNSLAFTMDPRKKEKTSKHIHTSKQQAGPTHNQQASRGSSTVDHGPGTTDPQA